MILSLLLPPFPDLDCGLLLNHGDVPLPLLERVDDVYHDTRYGAPFVAFLASPIDFVAIIEFSDKLQNKGG